MAKPTKTVKYDYDVLDLLLSKAFDLNLHQSSTEGFKTSLEVLLKIKSSKSFVESYSPSASSFKGEGDQSFRAGV
jgi:hypothetical protein